MLVNNELQLTRFTISKLPLFAEELDIVIGYRESKREIRKMISLSLSVL